MRIITRITPPGAKKKQKEKPPLRVAAYCRVSTERPEQETSLDLQVRYYTQRIESKVDINCSFGGEINGF